MRAGPRALVVAIGSLVLSGSAFAQDATQARQYSVPGHGSLVLKVPQGWQAIDRSLPNPPSVVLRFGPSAGDAFKILVTTVWIEPAKRNSRPESQKETVGRTAKNLLKQSVEKEVEILELKGDQTHGYYFSLTDREPATGPDDYKYITQGTLEVGELTTIFTIFMREPNSPVREQGLRMFADAAHSKAEAPAKVSETYERLRIVERGEAYELSVPVSRLVVTIPKTGRANMTTGTHPRYFYLVGETIVSGWFESAEKFKGIQGLWRSETEDWKRRGLPTPVDVAFSKEGSWEVILYDTPTKLGNFPHVRASLVQAGTWIDVHISLAGKPAPETRSKLLEVLRSIEVRERE